MEKAEVLRWDFIRFYPLFLKVPPVPRLNTIIISLVLFIASSFQKVLTSYTSVKTF